MKFVLRMLITAAVIFGVAYLSDGWLVSVDAFWPTAVIAALVLGLANAIIKPIVHVFTFPITLLTLGLFSFVINAAMLYVVEWIVPGFETQGFLRTVLAAIIISVISGIGGKLVDRD